VGRGMDGKGKRAEYKGIPNIQESELCVSVPSMLTSLNQAYESIKQCPISYDHPCELVRLNGIGSIIIVKADSRRWNRQKT